MINPVIEQARKYLSVPYHHQGRNRISGLDCAGLIIVVGEDLGYQFEDWVGYDQTPYASEFKKRVDDNLIRYIRPFPGCILLFRFTDEPQHLGIYTGKTIIHSYSKVGRVAEHRYADVWKKRTIGVYGYG